MFSTTVRRFVQRHFPQSTTQAAPPCDKRDSSDRLDV